tara:strand:- start:1385 stop:1714 length:330 start_codon:yes stop_codon:yes gene_type:complete
MSRNMEAEKVDTLMRMSGQDVAAQRQAVAAADAKMWDGISSAASSASSMVGSIPGGVGGGDFMSNVTVGNMDPLPQALGEFQSPASGQFDFTNNLGQGYGPQPTNYVMA